jgi:uncharacterized membrane protein
MRLLFHQLGARARGLFRQQPLRPLSGAAASPLPLSLAEQVHEFNREMEALFGPSVDSAGESRSEMRSAQTLPSSPACSDEATGAAGARLHSVAGAPAQDSSQELSRASLIIEAAFASGELSERERRYLRIMLRNADQQLLRLVATQQMQPRAPASAASSSLLDVLDERISHALLQQYAQR